MVTPNLTLEEEIEIRNRLVHLQEEHRDLDIMLNQLTSQPQVDMLAVQRMKKRKLLLKDQITLLRSKLIPDIIA